jgi:hypothetical protein
MCIERKRSMAIALEKTSLTSWHDLIDSHLIEPSQLYSFLSYSTSWNRTCTPRPGLPTTSAFKNCSPSSTLSILSNFCKILTTVKYISVSANCCPTHILGPPLNGIYVQGFGVQCSHRSGAKDSGGGQDGDSGG